LIRLITPTLAFSLFAALQFNNFAACIAISSILYPVPFISFASVTLP
jgi:hypothetical protein